MVDGNKGKNMNCSSFKTYIIWMQNRPDNGAGGPWRKIKEVVKARTNEEAQKKMRRKFANFGLTACALVALPEGISPNDKGSNHE